MAKEHSSTAEDADVGIPGVDANGGEDGEVADSSLQNAPVPAASDGEAGEVKDEDLEDGEVDEPGAIDRNGNGMNGHRDSSRNSTPVCHYFMQGRCYKGMLHPGFVESRGMPRPHMTGQPVPPGAAAMMTAAMMMQGAGHPFLRPGPGSPMKGGPNPAFMMPPQMMPRMSPFLSPGIGGEMHRSQYDEPEVNNVTADAIPGTPAAPAKAAEVDSWENAMKKAKELRRQASERRKAQLNAPPGMDFEPKAQQQLHKQIKSDGGGQWLGSAPKGPSGDHHAPGPHMPSFPPASVKSAAAKLRHQKDDDKVRLGERKSYKLDSKDGAAQWKKAGDGNQPGASRRGRARQRSASGSSRSSYSSRSYSGSSRSGSYTGSSYSGSSYTGSSYSGSSASRSRSRSPHRTSSSKKQQQHKNTDRARTTGKPAAGAQSRKPVGKIAPTKTSVPPPAPSPPKPPPAPQALKEKTLPVALKAAIDEPLSGAKATGQARSVAGAAGSTTAAKRPAPETGSIIPASTAAAKSAKLSKDDIMKQIAKLDAAIAKKRTVKK